VLEGKNVYIDNNGLPYCIDVNIERKVQELVGQQSVPRVKMWLSALKEAGTVAQNPGELERLAKEVAWYIVQRDKLVLNGTPLEDVEALESMFGMDTNALRSQDYMSAFCGINPESVEETSKYLSIHYSHKR